MILKGLKVTCDKQWVLSIMPKISENLIGIEMERSVAVSSNWNIRDHLWRWSTYFVRAMLTAICRSIFDKAVLCCIGEFRKGKKLAKAIPICWPSFIRKCCCIFLGYSNLPLTGWFGIIKSTQHLLEGVTHSRVSSIILTSLIISCTAVGLKLELTS